MLGFFLNLALRAEGGFSGRGGSRLKRGEGGEVCFNIQHGGERKKEEKKVLCWWRGERVRHQRERKVFGLPLYW